MEEPPDLLQPPLFGPTGPVYPVLHQFIRVADKAQSVSGTTAYPSFVQQWASNVAGFRDREKCYLIEPNGVLLIPALYDARLIGSLLGLPLYATSCCPSGRFSSSSSKGP